MSTPKRGFTLIELLVVITIVALLVSMLLPALANTRDLTTILACQARERSLFAAFSAYGYDYTEYPIGYVPGTTNINNVGLDNAGYLTGWTAASYTFNGVTYAGNATSVPNSQLPAWYNGNQFDPTSTMAHVASVGYLPDVRMFQCATTAKATFLGGYSRGYNCFNFNGPNTWGPGISNNGCINALNVLGHHPGGNQANPDWGVRFRDDTIKMGNTAWARSDVAMFVCPTLYTGGPTTHYVVEAHGINQTFFVGGNFQTDPGVNASITPLNRNALFADGHGVHVANTTHLKGLN